jgi:hypothetical protein
MRHLGVKSWKQKMIQDLVAKGFSERKARKAVNAVIALWKRALWRGEPVELPGGTAVVGRRKKGYKPIQELAKTPFGSRRYILRRKYKYRRIVRFRPDPNFE